jgi:two-component system, NtrC family, sensor histidine kinase HydH
MLSEPDTLLVKEKMTKRIFLPAGVIISLLLIWFALNNYRASRPMAEQNLHGLALSLTAAIENMAVHDPSLKSLADFHAPDIAYFAFIDRHGVYRFHSNPDLIGARAQGANPGFTVALQTRTLSEARVTLGTGETAYEFAAPFDLQGRPLILQLTLHTYRSDAVIRRAELNLAVLLALLVGSWVLVVILYRFARREEQHRLDMARRESLAQLGEMGAMLAHEIRNPLAGIKGYAQVIERKPQDNRNGGFAQRIVTEVIRLESLVNDLLMYSRSDTPVRSPIRVDELLTHSIAFIRSEAEQLKVTIKLVCPDGLTIYGNRDRLGQLLLNLGKNALQAMPHGGLLEIKARINGEDALVLTVTDSGQGIARDDLPRIFEPFFTTRARGTGLGLALCRKIVEEHQGSINVESTEGRGTSIEINLPVLSGDAGVVEEEQK